jgi:hypothetical protein
MSGNVLSKTPESTTVLSKCSTPPKSNQNKPSTSGTKRSASKQSFSAKKSAKKEEEWSCPICLASKSECAESNGGVYALICGHTFCTECVEEWLQQHDSCPVCKTRQQQHRRAPSGVFVGAGNQNSLTRFFLPPETPPLFAAITAALDQNSSSRSSSDSNGNSNGGSNAGSDSENPFSALLLNDIEALRRRVAMIRQETERREQQRRQQFEQRVHGGNVVGQQRQQHRDRNASTQEAVDDARFAAHMRLAIQQSLEDAERLQRAARTVVAESAAPNASISGHQPAASSSVLQTSSHPPPQRAISTNAANRRLIVHGTCQGQISADGRSVQCKVDGCRGVVLRANFARHCERMHGLEECPRCHNQIQHHMMKRHRMRECRNE